MSNKNSYIQFNESITDKLVQKSEAFSKRNAIFIDGNLYTYQQLFDYAKFISIQLQKFDDARCAILSNRNLTAYVSLLAVLLAGKSYIFLNTKDSKERIFDNFLLLETSILITDSHHKNFFNELIFKNKFIHLFHFDFEYLEISKVNYKKPKKVYQYAYMMFTSGSTGAPKCVPVSHLNLRSYLENIIHRSKPTEEDRFSQITELTFDLSVHDIFTCWSVGACLYVLPDNYIMGIPKYLQENKISFICVVPSTINLLYQLKKLPGNFLTIRYTIFCGEALSNHLAKLWHHTAPMSLIDNLYGPTEATVGIIIYRWNPALNQPIVPLGLPLMNQTIFLLDNNRCPVDHFHIGEIYLSGSQVTRGYWNNNKLSFDKYLRYDNNGLTHILYRTGDLAYYDPNHGYIYKGRSDDQMKIRGYRIEKIEIEILLKKIANTESAAVIPFENDSSGNILSLACFLANSKKTTNEIIKQCRQQMLDYMIPKKFIQLEQLPYNKNGKIDYQQLKNFIQ